MSASTPTPAEGYQQMAEDLIQKARVEGTLLSASRTLSDISSLQLTKDEREMLALAKDALADLISAVHGRYAKRAVEVVKAEERALTRKCQVGAMHPHYWIDDPMRKPSEMVRGAERYDFAISKVCPQHEKAGRRFD